MKTAAVLAISVAFVVHLPAHTDEEKAAADFHGHLTSVQMLDAKTGWAQGETEQGTFLLRTGDGGKSWTDISPRPLRSKQPPGTSQDDVGLVFLLQDAAHGWAYCTQDGDDKTNAPELFSTEDWGKHWQPHSFKTSVGDVADIRFVDRKHGFIRVESDAASGQSYKAVYRTTDGGWTWQTASEMSRDRRTTGALPHVGFGEGMVFHRAEDGWINGSPRGD